jgi:peptidoglycan/LPS O-acetylase OafA/YrhL
VNSPTQRHYGLQALRALAALAVFVHQICRPLAEVLPTDTIFAPDNLGALGVMTFFAISGYLMTYKISASPTAFAIARLRRILPALWAALLLSALVTLWRGSEAPLPEYWTFLLVPTGAHGNTMGP